MGVKLMFEVEVEWRRGHVAMIERDALGRRAATQNPTPRRATGPTRVELAAERRALEWLEAQPVPVVVASTAPRGRGSSVYVPVRASHVRVAPPDELPEAARLRKLASHRLDADRARKAKLSAAVVRAVARAHHWLVELLSHHRQVYPTDVPPQPRFRLVWLQDPPQDLITALRGLFQQMLGEQTDLPERRPPRSKAPVRLRGRRRKERPRTAPAVASNLGLDWTVFATVGGTPLSVLRCVDVATAFRDALVRSTDAPIALSSDAAASNRVALVPLPIVNRHQATVPLAGLALIWPRQLNLDARRAVLRCVARWERADGEGGLAVPMLAFGPGSWWRLERAGEVPPTPSLRPWTWCAPSLIWTTATPIALSLDPGSMSGTPQRRTQARRAAAQAIAASCTQLGLPRPHSVIVRLSSILPGSMDARFFPPFPEPAAAQRATLVHARIEFPHSVRGPVLLGEGSPYGLGLCRPLGAGRDATTRKATPMFDPWPF